MFPASPFSAVLSTLVFLHQVAQLPDSACLEHPKLSTIPGASNHFSRINVRHQIDGQGQTLHHEATRGSCILAQLAEMSHAPCCHHTVTQEEFVDTYGLPHASSVTTWLSRLE
ncbi:hypothetical protein MN608_00050 [Microdochium nivale]|nr:hypothetical protein MN608_00050 [Microdochium nivale]